MNTATTPRRIDLDALGFPAIMRQSGATYEVEADRPRAELQAAVDAAPLAPDLDGNASTIRQAAAAALQTNRDYVALSPPTAAQTTAQVRALCRQQNGLIRLLLGRLDGTT